MLHILDPQGTYVAQRFGDQIAVLYQHVANETDLIFTLKATSIIEPFAIKSQGCPLAIYRFAGEYVTS